MNQAIHKFLEGAVMSILLAAYFPCVFLFMRGWNRPDLGKLAFINTVIVVGFLVAGLVQLGMDGLAILLR